MTGTSKVELIVADARTLPLIQHLRYRALFADGQRARPGTDHDARMVCSESDRLGITFALFEGAELVSSVQVIPVSPMKSPAEFACFDLHHTLPRPDHGAVIVDNLVAAPERKGSKAFEPIMRAILDFVAREQRRYIVVLAEPPMRDFYASMGFDVLKDRAGPGASGRSPLMVFDMRDERHANGKTLAGWMFNSVFAG